MATWLSPLALSNTALLIATVIGAFGTLVLVPGTSGTITWGWVGVTVASQAAFAVLIVGVRHLSRAPGPLTVLLTLVVSGAIRGTIIAVGAGIVGLSAITPGSVISRSINSAVISVIGVALIGATLTWRADFRAQYRLLRDRALLLGSAAQEGDTIDPTVLDAWTSMKGDLDTTLRQASDRLAAGATAQDLRDAADLLTSAVDVNLRPASRAMWQETIPEDRPLRLRALFVETIARWQLPLGFILGFLAIVVGVGSLVRSGLIFGGAYTLRYLIVTGLILWASTALARARPRRAPVIAVVTLILLPPLVLACDYLIGDVLLGLPEDPTGQIIVALQTPVTTMFIAMAVEAVRDRQQVLDALQARIDAEAVELRRRGKNTGRDSQRLSLFVHHSVQSELSALAMQVREAAATNDAVTMEAARASALERLRRLEALDAYAPPWLREDTGSARITQIVQAWTGILDIQVDLPVESACRADQWQLAAQVIEEGLANSARHGHADHVSIVGRCESGDLILVITDDGTAPEGTSSRSGVGTQWLDRIAPGDWQLDQTPAGARLSVRIR